MKGLNSVPPTHAGLVQHQQGLQRVAAAPALLLRKRQQQQRGIAVASFARRHQHRVGLRLITVAAAASPSSSGDGSSSTSDGGLPFALSRPWRPLRFPWGRRLSSVHPSDMQVEVDAMLEGTPLFDKAPLKKRGAAGADLEALLRRVQADCGAAVPLVLAAKKARRPRWRIPAMANVSLVLCDDAYIRSLNAAHRGKDAATDVLSFEVPDEPGQVPPPIKLLGDLVISLDTAARQAEERG